MSCKFTACISPLMSKGFCRGHYLQQYRGQTLRQLRPKYATMSDRFWAKVDKSGECWTWTASRTASGYGQFDPVDVPVLAHRLSWMLHHGEAIPVGRFVLHRCDNPPCVRPDHLFIGTAKDNAADMTSKHRQAVGARLPQTKLTPRLVREMRARKAAGGRTVLIAKEFGVSEMVGSRAIRGKTWAWVK